MLDRMLSAYWSLACFPVLVNIDEIAGRVFELPQVFMWYSRGSPCVRRRSALIVLCVRKLSTSAAHASM